MEPSEIYDQLWNNAVFAFERSEPRIDSHLADKPGDLRRGITLAFRPPPPVRDAVAQYLDRLAAVCPGQYFYRPAELHVTVLNIISGTERWRREMRRLAACRPVITAALGRCRSFNMRFHGVTASPDSVLIQGFPMGDGLAVIRDELRAALAGAGFGDMPDRRYKVTAAHMTVMRFQKGASDLKPLLAFLKETRETDFGESAINGLQLIFGDWYASAECGRVLQEYPLRK